MLYANNASTRVAVSAGFEAITRRRRAHLLDDPRMDDFKTFLNERAAVSRRRMCNGTVALREIMGAREACVWFRCAAPHCGRLDERRRTLSTD
jgi:hypothetical protein